MYSRHIIEGTYRVSKMSAPYLSQFLGGSSSVSCPVCRNPEPLPQNSPGPPRHPAHSSPPPLRTYPDEHSVRSILAHLFPAVCQWFFVWMRYSLMWMRSILVWMRSSLVVRASGCQCKYSNDPGFKSSIRVHSEIWGAADEAVANTVHEIHENLKKSPLLKIIVGIYFC